MNKNPKDIVREGFDRIAEQYDAFYPDFGAEDELNEFMSSIKPRGHILDVGCGTGRVTRTLVDSGFRVTGIEISQKMLDLAKQQVPEATFEIGDMASLEYDDGSFDAIISTYAVFHVPRAKHFNLFLNLHRFLRKGGVLLLALEYVQKVLMGCARRMRSNLCPCFGVITVQRRVLNYSNLQVLRSYSRGMLKSKPRLGLKLIAGFLLEPSNIVLLILVWMY